MQLNDRHSICFISAKLGEHGRTALQGIGTCPVSAPEPADKVVELRAGVFPQKRKSELYWRASGAKTPLLLVLFKVLERATDELGNRAPACRLLLL